MRHEISRPTRAAAYCAMLCGVAVLFLAPAMASAPAAKPTLEQVGNKVYCLCGCVTLLNRCPHLPSECQSRAEMQAVIRAGIQKGETGPAILNDLVRRYGLKVLASPPAAGFDLAVWVLPGVALIAGLVIVLLIVKRWRARVAGTAAAASAEAPPVDPKILAAVEEEMNQIGPLKH